ncbi:MAG: hypothetical protein ACK553_07215 [Planctomycetota bacterium]|jgi:uncharacterized repeat protein (TIGR01451 family)
MSRYVFAAAAALFAGLLLILALSLAQRDARISDTLQVDAVPNYAEQVVAPISVNKAALEDEASLVAPRIESVSAGLEAQLASHTAPVAYEDPQAPPRFDASRILTKRPLDSVPSTPLLSPNGSRSAPPRLPVPKEPSDLGVPPPPPLNPPSFLGVPAPALPKSEPLSESVAEEPKPLGLDSSRSGLDAPRIPPMEKPISSPFAPPPAMATLGAPQAAPAGNALTTDLPAMPEPPRMEERKPFAPPTTNASGDSAPKSARGTWSMSSGSPGSRQFDGSQNPSLEILKRAPAEVQVGIPATFTAIVRNVGNATAFDVEVFDTVPRGAKLVRTLPQAEMAGADALVWKLGELAAGHETTISMELIPESEGELGSVASVKFAAQASVRTMSTLPKLTVKQWAPGEILGGDTIKVWIEVANVGTGTAKDVELQEDVPTAFRHVSGTRSLGLKVGDLAPGESQRYEIDLTAVEAAKVTNIVRATARNAATNESSQPMEIRAPKLHLQLNGPRIRYLERPAPFEAVIENVGTAVARDLYIVAYLPRGLHFSSANNEGTYLPEQHAIAWNLAELAAGTRATTEFTVLPVEEGKSAVRMTSDAEGLGVESIQRDVQVEGQSELTFDIDDDHDPIETGGVTTYTVQLTNIGTRPDQNVALSVEIPDGSSVEQIESPMKYRVQGRTVVFDPYPALPPKDRAVAKVRVRHSREGTQVFRASIQSALRPVPVIKEESTKVYIDR